MQENDTTETEVVVDTDEQTEDVAETTDTEPEETDEAETEPETFPRDYVEKLRKESARYRERAQQSDSLAARLHTALVAASGRLADPTDLPFDAAHLDDEEALTTAIDDLLGRKPHLASRKPTGDVGQGVGTPGQTVDLAGLLRAGV